MPRLLWIPSICLSLLVCTVAADADLRSPLQVELRPGGPPRIVRVETDLGRLFIAGENLPEGSGVKVRLGSEELRVLSAVRSLVVAELPRERPDRLHELVVERGVVRAVVRGRGLEWGMHWNTPPPPPQPATPSPAAEVEVEQPPK